MPCPHLLFTMNHLWVRFTSLKHFIILPHNAITERLFVLLSLSGMMMTTCKQSKIRLLTVLKKKITSTECMPLVKYIFGYNAKYNLKVKRFGQITLTFFHTESFSVQHTYIIRQNKPIRKHCIVHFLWSFAVHMHKTWSWSLT